MKDIDFDELDKAVSSILGGDKSQISDNQPVPGSEPVSSSSIPVTTSATDKVPVSTFNTPKTNPQSQTTEDDSLPLTTRRSGRFMDVVHPSSDMGGSANSGAPRASLPMTGRTLQPVNEDVTPEPVEPVKESNDPDASLDTQMPITKATDPSTLISTEDTKDTVWPDPLDVHEDTVTLAVDMPVAQSKTDTLPASLESEPIAPIVETVPLIENTQAPTSPFISDAKVEKRPLGAFSDQPAAVIEPESPPTPEIAKSEDEDEQLAPEIPPIVTTGPLPRELESDIVALEGNDHTVEADASDSNPGPERDDTPSESTTPSVSGAALSIPQQYKTAERNQKNGDEHPIFDTTEYHAALPAKTKKKSSLGMWIGILVLLVVLVAAAAGVWWFYLK
ncbi:MAG: hypothetical protein ACMG55_14580 [Microcoleus sp.]